MKTRFLILALALILWVTMNPAAAFAKEHSQGKGHDKSHDKGNSHAKGHDRDDDSRPPGWDKGKKTGWGDRDLPPGQAKKHGAATHTRHAHTSKHRTKTSTTTKTTTTTTSKKTPTPTKATTPTKTTTKTSTAPTTSTTKTSTTNSRRHPTKFEAPDDKK